MKRFVYILGIIILVGVLIVSFVVIKVYNKPHKDVASATPEYVISVKDLADDFHSNEKKANKKYLDKVVQIEGDIIAISTNNGKTILTLGQKGSTTEIICTLDASQNKKVFTLNKGQTITVKGICTGFLMDVMLVRAIIIN